MVSIDTLKEIKKVIVKIENRKIEGEVIEVEQDGKIIISIPPIETIFVQGKKCEIYFEKDGVQYSMEGKIFSQKSEKTVFLPETDILSVKRIRDRFETQFIKCKLVNLSSKFLKETIEGNIIDISLSGAKVVTNIPLSKDFTYELNTNFIINRKSYFFRAKCKLAHSEKKGDDYFSGLQFIELDALSHKNLYKYIKYIM
ncbi:MAG: PilZ domain-containing protein [Candidatus Omnitrophica bacterium]|nr:PilZ domain-containing protein [Candidatus Omnitrophota bacterium]